MLMVVTMQMMSLVMPVAFFVFVVVVVVAVVSNYDDYHQYVWIIVADAVAALRLGNVVVALHIVVLIAVMDIPFEIVVLAERPLGQRTGQHRVTAVDPDGIDAVDVVVRARVWTMVALALSIEGVFHDTCEPLQIKIK